MSALPFTLAILLILSVSSVTSVRRNLDTQVVLATLTDHMEASKDLYNALQATKFEIKKHTNLKPGRKAGSKRHTPSQQTPHEEKAKTPTQKASKPLDPLALPEKFNLAPALFEGEGGEVPLYRELLATLLVQWYPSLIPSERVAQELVDALRHRLTLEPKAEDFQGDIQQIEHLASVKMEPAERRLWCQILKGKEGVYPALCDLATLNREQMLAKVSVPFAPKEILLSLFGDSIVVAEVEAKRNELICTDDDEVSSLNERKEALQLFVEGQIATRGVRCERFAALLDYSLTHHPGSTTVRAGNGAMSLKRRVYL